MHYILKNTSLRCTSFSNKMYGWHIQQYFQSESFLLPLVRHHSYKNEQDAIQGSITPSRECTTYSWRIQPSFVQYSLQPIISFERSSNCAEHAKKNQTCACIFAFSQRYSTQFTAQKETVQDTAVFSRSACLKFQLRFHARNALFPCKCVIFFDKAALLRQNIDDAWKRSRFNCS